MMKVSAAVLITAVVVCSAVTSTFATRGVILTAPRSLMKNAVNKLYLNLYEVDAPGTIAISLENPTSQKVIAETVVNVESGENEKTIELKVPEHSEYRMSLWANGTFSTKDGYTFYEQDEVYSHSESPVITFIQTDKPLYKPGQQVKFRVLPVDRTLKPLGKDTQGEIYIEDTVGSRIAQWKNVSLGAGIQQFEFPLSEEPPLGKWKISVLLGGRTENSNFEVKEYVLPKYEVTVTPPSFVLADAETITFKICAKYTYGKQVQGSLKINSSLEAYSSSWSTEKFPVLEFEDRIDGCYNYDVNVSLIDQEYRRVYRRIQVVAEVTEDGTGVTRQGTGVVQRSYNVLFLNFLEEGYKQYFKSGIPYTRKIKVTQPDNNPAPNEDVEVCATISKQKVLQRWWATMQVKYCRNYTSDNDGIILFQVPPQDGDTTVLVLEAKSYKYDERSYKPGKPRLSQPQSSTTAQAYYSPSKNYIQVRGADDKLRCGTFLNAKVIYTAQDGANYTFYYQVISKGKVVRKGSKAVTFTSAEDISQSLCKDRLSVNEVRIPLVPSAEQLGDSNADEDIDCSTRPIGTTEINVDIEASMSSSFSLLVYYIRDDDEIIADSAKFLVEKCFQNKVDFRFGDQEKQPGAKTTTTLKASPNSLCGTKVVDKSIVLLDSSGQLTKEKVFQELEKSVSQQYYHRDHCNDRYRKGGKNKSAQSMILPPRPWSSSDYADALSAFEDTGFVVLSDLKLLTRPCTQRQNIYPSSHHVAYAAADYSAPGVPGPPDALSFEMDSSRLASPSNAGPSATKSVVDVRSFFPETWMFDIESVGENGELVSKVTLPHTITEWIGSAVCVNEADGLGLSDVATVRGFQAFFLSFTLPYSVIRGENCPLIISIFNYVDKCLPITRTISVTVNSDNDTVLEEKSASEVICVCGGSTSTYKYMFTPEKVGTLNLTVLAESARSSTVCGDQATSDVVARDMATRSLQVEAEGFPQEKVTSFLFCPKNYDGSSYNGSIDLIVPDDAVEGSKRAFIAFSGDIMGPAIEGLDRLVRLPTGCGEQNMVLFTPNIVVLDYLISAGKLTEEIKTKALKNLQTGYQRELKYRHPDGSYSAFGITDREGSMWLSAFVLRSYSQARKYIDIDEKDITQTVKWITDKQGSDGCFPQVGRVFSQSLKGGLGSQGQNKTAPLTAYVLTALLTAGYQNQTLTRGALICIASDADLTPYTAALYGYATALAGSPDADKYLEWLSQKAIREGNEMYWKNVKGSKSMDVETAAYVIMATLKKKGEDGLPETLSIVRHLTRMRNANGGFISTQDTVVGLEAISSVASLISKDPVQLTIKLSGAMMEKTITITEDDKLLVKKNRVPLVPSTLQINAVGSGCGLVQAAVRYNVLVVPKQQFFTISVDAARTDICRRATINVCVSYLPENQKSNMALVEIKMVSGFAAVKETLQKLSNDVIVQLKRFEIENNNVVLYFDELINERKCFKFDVEEVTPVENTKPATAKVYDYYAKENEESADYKIEGSC